MVASCDCAAATGCPGCVQHTHCSEYNSVIHKGAAEVVLRLALEHEMQQGDEQRPAGDGFGFLPGCVPCPAGPERPARSA